jgi:hypothetical protein
MANKGAPRYDILSILLIAPGHKTSLQLIINEILTYLRVDGLSFANTLQTEN